MPYSHRSAFSKFRCGVAPIRLETGRFERLKVEDRVCFHCKNADIEDEFHVMLKCPLYHDIRVTLFTEALKTEAEFLNFDDCEKLKFLFSNSEITRLCAKTCFHILKRRSEFLYCK